MPKTAPLHPCDISERRETILKCALIDYLRHDGELSHDAVVASEFVVDKWANRADIVVANGKLSAFEIKSASDKLERLPKQIEAFSRYFDKVTVVVEERHLLAALKLVPKNVGLWLAYPHKKSLAFRVIKPGNIRVIKNKANLIELLTANELRSFLRSHNIPCAQDRRTALADKAKRFSSASLHAAALCAVKARFSDTDCAFKKAVKGGITTAKDLRLLSRYRDQRQQAQKLKEDTWSFWQEKLETVDSFTLWGKTEALPFGDVPPDIHTKIRTSA